MAQAKIFHYCPQCGEKFHPNRLGQLFCSQEHGWQYRNLMRMTKEASAQALLKGKLENLKILMKLSLSGDCSHSTKAFQAMGFNPYYAQRERDYEYGQAQFYSCFGFGVVYDRNEVTVFAAWDDGNPLNVL